ncbi:RNA degradosome polyphosphate kinase [Candidatus Foliamicus sp.]
MERAPRPLSDAEHAGGRLINRELSWLQFNTRVLEEADNRNHPLLERVRFLSISASNLDEFYMVRAAGLMAQVAAGVTQASDDGLQPAEQLRAIRRHVKKLLKAQSQRSAQLLAECREAGVAAVQPDELGEKAREWLAQWFENQLFPVLTPQAVDPAHPFPFIQSGCLVYVLRLKRPEDKREFNGLVLVPPQIERFVRVPGENLRFVAVEDIIAQNFKRLFPGMAILGHGIFRISRDSDLEIDEEAEDLVRTFETALLRRRRGNVIRVDVAAGMPKNFRRFVLEAFDASHAHVFDVEGMLGLADIAQIISGERPDLQHQPLNVRYPERVREYGGDILAAIRAKDFVVHHPYESFDVVVQFLRRATADPAVVAIKQTLYRTSEDSPIVEALIAAAEAGKLVTAMVELRARFDEAANIRWAREMERAGVQVVYGFMELKTHAKVAQVVRREAGELRTYTHFGTGNYHPVNARVYVDLSYFTCDPALGRDTARLFNYMTGYAAPEYMEKLIYAPAQLKQTLVELIEDEIAYAREGRPAQIWAKLNSLVDPEIIDCLYRASQAGVSIELYVRGICCLRPRMKGLSQNIRVRSMVGRFLEHARILCFGAGHKLPSTDSKVFLSSADWMPRNLHRRVEALVPVENETVKRQLVEQVLMANRMDVMQSWEMQPDGSYRRLAQKPDGFSAHTWFMTHPSLSGRGSARQHSRPAMPGELFPDMSEQAPAAEQNPATGG